MNPILTNLTAQQLRKAATIKERIEALQNEFNQILGVLGAPAGNAAPSPKRPKRRKTSAAGRANIIAGVRARWAKVKGQKQTAKPKRKMSAAWRAKLAAIARARWRKARALGRTTL
jgi:hypothetical protein